MKVTVNNLTYAFSDKVVLNKLSFNLESGDFLLIHGRNGTGKSTLIKCFTKTYKISDGMIKFDDQDINKIKIYKNVGLVPQRSEFNFEFPITVHELLSCAYHTKRDDYYNRVVARLNLKKIYKSNINDLSGGQIQRVFIARALLNRPKLLLLDEPIVGVDRENVLVFYNILKKLKSQGVTVILISHVMDFCTDLANYILTMGEDQTYEFKKNEISEVKENDDTN